MLGGVGAGRGNPPGYPITWPDAVRAGQEAVAASPVLQQFHNPVCRINELLAPRH